MSYMQSWRTIVILGKEIELAVSILMIKGLTQSR